LESAICFAKARELGGLLLDTSEAQRLSEAQAASEASEASDEESTARFQVALKDYKSLVAQVIDILSMTAIGELSSEIASSPSGCASCEGCLEGRRKEAIRASSRCAHDGF
jgi:hypothetical protein